MRSTRSAIAEVRLVQHHAPRDLGEVHEVADRRHGGLGRFADAVEVLDEPLVDVDLLRADRDRRDALHRDRELHADLLDERDPGGALDGPRFGGALAGLPYRPELDVVDDERVPHEQRLAARLRSLERLRDGNAGQRLRRRLQLERDAERLVRELDLALGVLDHERRRRGFGEREKPQRREVQRPLALALRPDVEQHRDHPRRLVARVERGLERDLHPAPLVSRACERGVDEGRAHLAFAHARDVLLDALAGVGGEERGEGGALEVGAEAPDELGEGGIGEDDRALRVGDREREVDRFERALEVFEGHPTRSPRAACGSGRGDGAWPGAARRPRRAPRAAPGSRSSCRARPRTGRRR
jgi:hypothetical protein